jgi:hypothetical protein
MSLKPGDRWWDDEDAAPAEARRHVSPRQEHQATRAEIESFLAQARTPKAAAERQKRDERRHARARARFSSQ